MLARAGGLLPLHWPEHAEAAGAAACTSPPFLRLTSTDRRGKAILLDFCGDDKGE